jgi:hypothetical protein
MGVRTTLLGITLTSGEIATLQAAAQDGVGNLQFAQEKAADAIQVLNSIIASIPAGSNKTALQVQVTALT